MLYRYNNTTCCTVTTTQHAVPFHVWHLLMFFSMLHVLHPYISVHPCCTPAPVHPIPVHTHRYNHERYNGTQPQHSTDVPLCTVTFRFNWDGQLLMQHNGMASINWELFTDVTLLRVELGIKHVLQYCSAAVPISSSQPAKSRSSHPLQNPLKLYLQDSLH